MNSASISTLEGDSYLLLGLLIDNKFSSHFYGVGGLPLLHATCF